MSAKKTARRSKASKAPKRKAPAKTPTKAPAKAAAKANTKAKKAAARKPAPRPKVKTAARAPKAKAAAKAPKAKAPKKAGKAKAPIARRDGTGHLDPHYAATLREQSSERPKDDNRAFFKGSHSKDDLAEELGEEVVDKMTSGEDEGEDVLDQRVPEEDGGPFVETSASTEFGYETDASNPKGAKREPFPTT